MMSFPKIEGYVVTEKLGSGSYSIVYKAYTKVGSKQVVAIKCIDKSKVKDSPSAIDNLLTEIRLLKTLKHPHIVHMHDFIWDAKNIYIIMEFCSGGDLSKFIKRFGYVPEKKVRYFTQQLVSALKFLREKDVVHMDLKPHNLLLDKSSEGEYTLKVADFGFAQYLLDSASTGIRGSPLYMAPELYHSASSHAKADLWSLGVIIYECLFGKAPYSSATFNELMDKIQNKEPISIPSKPKISEGCTNLLQSLLQHDPDKRISYEQLFDNEYLDIEYMPCKENYEKGVALIRRAVTLENEGKLSSALTRYSSGLRHLIPELNRARDAAALRDKLHSYMDRAEQIKQQLNSSTVLPSESLVESNTRLGHVSTVKHVPSKPNISTCCTGVYSGTSYVFSNTQNQKVEWMRNRSKDDVKDEDDGRIRVTGEDKPQQIKEDEEEAREKDKCRIT